MQATLILTTVVTPADKWKALLLKYLYKLAYQGKNLAHTQRAAICAADAQKQHRCLLLSMHQPAACQLAKQPRIQAWLEPDNNS
jgi:hypothetical protein